MTVELRAYSHHAVPISKNERDWTPAFREAQSDLLLNAGGGTIVIDEIPELVYVDDFNIASNIELKGAGWPVLAQAPGALYALSINSGAKGTPDPRDNTHNVALRDFVLRGRLREEKHHEHRHLLNINAATDIDVVRVRFEFWQGDAIYLGSSNKANTERHNENVRITSCSFHGGATERGKNARTGATTNNRNFVSVIDCTGLTMRDLIADSTGSANMPGGIQIEPNHNSFHRIGDIEIDGVIGRDVGGISGLIGISLPPKRKVRLDRLGTISVRNVTGDRLDQNGFSFIWQGEPTDEDPYLDIVVENLRTTSAERPFTIVGGKGISIRGGMHQDAFAAALIGYRNSPAENCASIAVEGVTFLRCGHHSAYAIEVYGVRGLDLIGNTFIDCGYNANGSAIIFKHSDQFPVISDLVKRSGNTFIVTDGQGRGNIIGKDRGHRFGRYQVMWATESYRGYAKSRSAADAMYAARAAGQ